MFASGKTKGAIDTSVIKKHHLDSSDSKTTDREGGVKAHREVPEEDVCLYFAVQIGVLVLFGYLKRKNQNMDEHTKPPNNYHRNGSS